MGWVAEVGGWCRGEQEGGGHCLHRDVVRVTDGCHCVCGRKVGWEECSFVMNHPLSS
jgi:hypothetical protein